MNQNSDKNRNTLEDNFYVYVTKIRNTSTFMKYTHEIKTLQGIGKFNLTAGNKGTISAGTKLDFKLKIMENPHFRLLLISP